ncbi:MAG: DUF1080 domain-containing protein [Bryobacterales bacterium]|nr:DUF1080 domain-containing protein [Bryobacterales bacterium]
MSTAGRILFTALLISTCCLQAAEPGWVPLFDGKSLAGWREAAFQNRGAVAVNGGTIVLGKGSMTGIAWTGQFPASGYEIRFEAARLEGNDFFAGLTFPAGGSHCFFVAGGWDGTTVGLSNVDGYDASENETSINRDFVTGRWYAFHLAVTDRRIQAWIDGALVIDLDLTASKVELRFDETDLCKPLGFASFATRAGLRHIEYRLLPPATQR